VSYITYVSTDEGLLNLAVHKDRRYSMRQDAVRDITEYIEIFYNRQRRQARLEFLPPAAFAHRFYAGLPAA
jgi:transposase InsO family protein